MAGNENITVLRLMEGRLAACTPGSDEHPQWLDEHESRARLQEASAQRRRGVPFRATVGHGTAPLDRKSVV